MDPALTGRHAASFPAAAGKLAASRVADGAAARGPPPGVTDVPRFSGQAADDGFDDYAQLTPWTLATSWTAAATGMIWRAPSRSRSPARNAWATWRERPGRTSTSADRLQPVQSLNRRGGGDPP